MHKSRLVSLFIRYGSAIAAVLLATVLRSVLRALGDSGISPLFFAAVIFTAWFGGTGPGVLATILSGAATAYVLHANTPEGARDTVLRVLVFTVVALLTSSLNAALKRAAESSRAAADAYRKAKEAAEEASAAKSKFVAIVSHELRAPLVPVAMVADAMEVDPTLPAPLRHDAQMIRRGINIELRLIDDLADLSRIGGGKLNLKLERIDAHDPLAAAIRACEHDAHDSQLELRSDLSANHTMVSGDATRLQQVFWNLIRNAIKFTPPGGRIFVRTSNAGSGELLVEVRDNGIGIDPQKLSKIFEAFEQAGPDIAARFGGLGLGLAIVQGLVEAHGGTITAGSEGINRGAVFSVRLPIAGETSAKPATHDTSAAAQR
ncbi:MAG TPA: ATP-binding protein [Humisphaera sp.]|jgi:signal transduction histidine kinase|nr:ATP-binding protein [Humisphaera sp.]